MRNIVVLTGAGISAESGIQTFRGANGLWNEQKIEDVATPEGFARDPEKVLDFYNQRRKGMKNTAPNPAHLALAQLAQHWPGQFTLITQNIDDLHERALNDATAQPDYCLIHMHGMLSKIRCNHCNSITTYDQDVTIDTACPACGKTGGLRPHVVWFGEMPLMMDVIYDHLRNCDLFISIGTSGNVYPAAGFVQEVRRSTTAHTVELNMEPSLGVSSFHEAHCGLASKLVPDYVDQVMRDYG